MKKRLEDIERNIRSILEEVNKISTCKYLNLTVSFWSTDNSKSFKINLWDGEKHAPINLFSYEGSAKELVAWIACVERKKEILFQKFDKVLQEEKK